MKRKWPYLAALLAVGIPVTALAYAPYLPRLLWEGYPAATWPAPGSFAEIEGSGQKALPRAERVADPNAKLSALFETNEGRAILVARSGQVVMEHYAPGITREMKLNSYSLAKSLIGKSLLFS